jgi:uncharacterized protein (DUF302 family)/uncharacterized membrane protein YidH (DUF202 family)
LLIITAIAGQKARKPQFRFHRRRGQLSRNQEDPIQARTGADRMKNEHRSGLDAAPEVHQGASLSDYLAAERTLLAWIRTGLALMGFGFVVARFGLFLQQLQILQRTPTTQPLGLSLWFGTALITTGILVSVFAGLNHVRLIRTLNRGQAPRFHPSSLAAVTAFFLALVGLGMAIYLVSVRNSTRSQSEDNQEMRMTPSGDKGIIEIPSHSSVEKTVEKLTAMLEAKGITLFALVDHSGGAEKAGMKMPPTKLLIFGSPKGGTPVMLAAPSAAIDLPLKILVRKDDNGKVWISYNSPEYLRDRHGIPQELLPNIAGVGALAAKAGE